jgi:hypothetical protein
VAIRYSVCLEYTIYHSTLQGKVECWEIQEGRITRIHKQNRVREYIYQLIAPSPPATDKQNKPGRIRLFANANAFAGQTFKLKECVYLKNCLFESDGQAPQFDCPTSIFMALIVLIVPEGGAVSAQRITYPIRIKKASI